MPGPSTRRRTTSVAAASALALLAACGSSSSDDASSPGSPAATGAPAGTLTIWADAKRTAALTPLATAWGEENGVTVRLEEISEDLQTNFVTASQAGNAPDVVVGAHDWIGNLVQNGAIEPVNLADPTAFDPVAVEALTFDGQVYGVPYAVENLALLRNTDLAPDAPATVEDMVAAGRAAVAAGRATQPAILQVGQGGDVYHLQPLLTSAGGGIFATTPDGDADPAQVVVDSEASRRAMSLVRGLGEQGAGVLKRSIGAENSIAQFTSGSSPFIVTGPWAVPDVKQAGIPYAVSPVPGWKGLGPARPFVGVQAFFVASRGDNPALAQEFAATFGGSEQAQVALYEAEPRRPALTAALDRVGAADPDLAAFAEAGRDGTPLPVVPQMAAVWDPLGKAQAAIVGGAAVEPTLAAAAAAIRAAVG